MATEKKKGQATFYKKMKKEDLKGNSIKAPVTGKTIVKPRSRTMLKGGGKKSK